MLPSSAHDEHPTPTLLTRRKFLVTGSAALAGLALYSGTHARHEFEITDLPLAIRDLPDAFVGVRVVQINDLHLAEYTESWFLERIVAEVNQLNPDIVLMPGDFVSRGPRQASIALEAAGRCAEIMSRLQAPLRFATLGNHDVAVGAERVIASLQAHSIPVLVDSFFAFDRGGDRLWICGADDAGTRNPDLHRAIPADPRAPVILMVHEPDYAAHVRRHPRFPRVDVMLSGHSHGGQVRLPGIGPLILPPMGKQFVAGHFQLDHMQLYVNRGIGTVGLPFRLNCPAEITLFTLARA